MTPEYLLRWGRFAGSFCGADVYELAEALFVLDEGGAERVPAADVEADGVHALGESPDAALPAREIL
jgi:hypothetical protein